MMTIGKVEEFDPEWKDWQSYEEWLTHFFSAKGITQASRKKSMLLSVMGTNVYKLLRSLISSDKPGDKDYKDPMETMKKHYSLLLSEIVQRYKFHTCFRELPESVANYMSALRSIAEYYNFAPTLDATLCNWLVCGIRDDAIQCRLLAEPDLKLAKAFKLAQSMEVAAKNVKELHQPISSATLEFHKVRGEPQTSKVKGGATPNACSR